MQGNGWNDVGAFTYISVPGDVPKHTGLCHYQFPNINTSLAASGKDSCNGVISSGCSDYFQNAPGGTAKECPALEVGEEFDKACPELSGNRGRSMYIPRHFSRARTIHLALLGNDRLAFWASLLACEYQSIDLYRQLFCRRDQWDMRIYRHARGRYPRRL